MKEKDIHFLLSKWTPPKAGSVETSVLCIGAQNERSGGQWCQGVEVRWWHCVEFRRSTVAQCGSQEVDVGA